MLHLIVVRATNSNYGASSNKNALLIDIKTIQYCIITIIIPIIIIIIIISVISVIIIEIIIKIMKN